ncbi:hypothetical protein ACIPLR_15870 [Herbaspirillum huttiense]|uniref:hypothetical protein n=1 Tax=Herbaspirillum huttiense TaxID=863372 RepID=UPI0037F877C8
MTYPKYGTKLIECAKRGCDWRGKETDRVSVPAPRRKGVSYTVCPKCGEKGYYFAPENAVDDEGSAS